ncbi:16S rRNA (adenine(1518)-N(6)/adenine(1519)-N(6))-dimethyltransferase RsmA [Candidatus Gracilibacteria bacterium]|nr:16S rRNA (adenine(1518)-N(6)/adenine(1519)-N(6))-dimethyltransferase RsmA [Candidatus Gracilibacteria bacterium]
MFQKKKKKLSKEEFELKKFSQKKDFTDDGEIKSLTGQKFLRDTLHKFGFHTKKNLGQNFLIDKMALEDIIDSAEISKDDDVIEIGPGPGVLTQVLVKKAKSVTALEIDETVIPVLKYSTQEPENLTILHQNAVEYIPEKPGYILCANIPYYLTSPLIRHFITAKNPPKRLVFLMQKEVAQRICEKAKNMSVLSLEVLVFGQPSIELEITREKFFPAPNVDSAVLKIEVFDKPLIEKKDLPMFWDLIHNCFSEKRKKISNTLAKYRQMGPKKAEEIFEKTGVSGDLRPQALTIPQWDALVQEIKNKFGFIDLEKIAVEIDEENL